MSSHLNLLDLNKAHSNLWAHTSQPHSSNNQTSSPFPSNGPVVCIFAEQKYSNETKKVLDCFQTKSIRATSNDLNAASHFFVLVTDGLLKSKEHILPLIESLTIPYFSQRLFAAIVKEKVDISIFKPGEELAYITYWNEILKNTNINSSEYREIKKIADNISVLIKAIRGTIIPHLEELLQTDLATVIAAINARTHLLQSKHFFHLPIESAPNPIGLEENLVKLSDILNKKAVVIISGERGVGKTTLALEYAKQSESYSSGIFLLDADNQETLNKSFESLAVKLNVSAERAKEELHQLRSFLLIFDNVKDQSLIPSFPQGHTIVVGHRLIKPDINVRNFTREDAIRHIKTRLEVSSEDAQSLINEIWNSNPAEAISDALAYIKISKISVQDYLRLWKTQRQKLLQKQQDLKKIKALPALKQSVGNHLTIPSPSLEKYIHKTVDELANEIASERIQIFISYNWNSTHDVNQIDEKFNNIGIQLFRDARELRKFESVRGFMSKMIRHADYTLSIITDDYLKSFNCLYEIVTTMKDPNWKMRVFPILLLNMNLDDATILSYQEFWQKQAERFKVVSGSEEVKIAQEGAANIAKFLQFVKEIQPEHLQESLKTNFHKTIALMLARQEILEKKCDYKLAVFYLPVNRNKYFTGRDHEIVLLENSLRTGIYSAITNTGMGGVGKSQLAMEYAYRHAVQYELIYWIRSENLTVLKADLRMLGEEMGISEAVLKDDSVIFTIKEALENRQGWLLIFDNAEDPETLKEVLPKRGGHILITSRNPNWDNTLNLNVFSLEEAVQYVQKQSGIHIENTNEADVRLLATELGHLPLALGQAAFYIKNQNINFADYLARYKEKRNELLAQTGKGYPESIATTWQMSMEKVAQEDRNAIKLLTFCSYLAPDNIPGELLEAWLKNEIQNDVSFDFHEALRVLESYSLITQKVEQKDGVSKKLIFVHRLIQEVTRTESKDEVEKVIQSGVKVISEQFFDSSETQDELEVGKRLAEHARIFQSHCSERKIAELGNVKILERIGNYLRLTDDLKGADEFFKKASDILYTLYNVETHKELRGDCETIVLSYQKKIFVGSKNLKCVVKIFLGLGHLFMNKKNLGRAKEYYQNGLECNILCSRDKTIEVADCYYHLGKLYLEFDAIDRAKENFEKSLYIRLEIRESIKDKQKSAALAETYNALGLVYKADNELEFAKNYSEKALAELLDSYENENHLSFATCYCNLGLVLLAQGSLKEAKECIQKALNINIACYRTEIHSSVALCHEYLGLIFESEDQLEEANGCYQKALELYEASYGTKSNLNVAKIFGKKAEVLSKQGNFEEAKVCLENAINVCRNDENGINRANYEIIMGDFLSKMGDYKGAERSYKAALGTYSVVFSRIKSQSGGRVIEVGEPLGINTNMNIMSFLINYGYLHLKCDRTKYSLSVFNKLLKIIYSIYKSEKLKLAADTHSHLGDAYLVSREFDKARQEYSKAKAIYLQIDESRDNKLIEEKIQECELLMSYEAIGIDVLSKKEAFEYLSLETHVKYDEHALNNLIEQLGRFSLGLTLARAYLNVTKIDLVTYLESFKEKLKIANSFNNSQFNCPKEVIAVWMVTFDKIVESDQNALKMLSFCSCQVPSKISEELVETWWKESEQKNVDVEYRKALRLLQKFSMIGLTPQQKIWGKERAILVHNIVQKLTKNACKNIQEQPPNESMISTLNTPSDRKHARNKEELEAKESYDSEEKAVEYLKAIIGSSGEEDQLYALARELEHLSLSMTLAGSYVKAEKITVANYLSKYKMQILKYSNHEKNNELPVSLLAVHDITMGKVEQQNSLAFWILEACSYLNCDNISTELIKKFVSWEKNIHDVKYQEAILVLEKFSIFKRANENLKGPPIVSIHPLLQKLILQKRKRMLFHDILIDRVICQLAKQDEKDKDWIAHARSIVPHAIEQEIGSPLTMHLSSLVIDIVGYLNKEGNYEKALEYCKDDPLNSPFFGRDVYVQRGIALSKLGDFDEGRDCYKKALKMQENVLRQDNKARDLVIEAEKIRDERKTYRSRLQEESLSKAQEFLAQERARKKKRGGEFYHNLGELCCSLKQVEIGSIHFLKAKEIYEELGLSALVKIIDAKIAECEELRYTAIDYLCEEEALKSLKEISIATDRIEELESLAEELGYSNLATKMAVSFIKAEKINIGTYTTLFQEVQKMAVVRKDDESYSVERALNVILERLKKENHGAILLLNLCSHLTFKDIPKDFLKKWWEKNIKTKITLEETLKILETYSLINLKTTQIAGKEKSLISIHQTIQKITRDQCAKRNEENPVYSVIAILNQILMDKINAPEELENVQVLLQNAKTLESYIGDHLVEEVGDFIHTIGFCYSVIGELGPAMRYYDKVLKIYRTCFGSEKHRKVANAYLNLGNVLIAIGDIKGGREYLLSALKIMNALGADDNNKTVITIHQKLGKIYQELHQPDKAKVHFDKGSTLSTDSSYKSENHIANVRELCISSQKIRYPEEFSDFE